MGEPRPLRPNLVVGVLGAAIVLVIGTLLATQWRGLTDQHDFVADVSTRKHSFGFRSGSVGSNLADTQFYQQSQANVFRVAELRVTCDEGGVLPGQSSHTVTVALFDPANREIGRETGSCGQAGITIARTLLEVPEARRFTARGDGQDRFAELYPEDRSGIGTWRATISAARAAGPGPTGIDYTITFVIEHYQVRYAPAAPATK